MKEIILKGSHYEIGKQHGLFLKDEIQGFLKDDLAQINRLCTKPINKQNLAQYVLPYSEIIKESIPEIFEEIKGLALGAEISLEEAVLLQIRREIIGTSSFTLMGDCSSFGIHNPDHSVLGQTIDLNGSMTGIGHVFRMKYDDKPELLQYSFAGLLGYMGMNKSELAVTINLVISDGWTVGIPPYLLVRKFLECECVEECIELVKKLPIASSRSFIISDKQKQIVIELTPSAYKIIESNFLVHTNHYVHEDFKKIDRLNIFSRNSSFKRLKILESHLREKNDFDAIQSIFKDHSLYPVGICAHNDGNIKLNETVASVIMYPQKGHFYALKGKPCENNYSLYQI